MIFSLLKVYNETIFKGLRVYYVRGEGEGTVDQHFENIISNSWKLPNKQGFKKFAVAA